MPQRVCSSPSICCPRPAPGRGLRLQAESLGPGAFSFCMAYGGDRKGHSLAVHVEEELLQRNRAPRDCPAGRRQQRSAKAGSAGKHTSQHTHGTCVGAFAGWCAAGVQRGCNVKPFSQAAAHAATQNVTQKSPRAQPSRCLSRAILQLFTVLYLTNCLANGLQIAISWAID